MEEPTPDTMTEVGEQMVLNHEDEDYSREENLMSILIPEILTKIFTYLPLDDRKNGKLVCGHWYNILTCSTFQKKEKIVCRGVYSAKEIISTLATFKCTLYCLDFQFVKFEKYPVNFWKKRGGEIRELTFNKSCLLNDKTIVEMMKHCVNLTHWSMAHAHRRFLNLMIKNRIVRKNVISFAHSFDEMTESALIQLFAVLPEIRELKLHMSMISEGFFRKLSQSHYIREGLVLSSLVLPMDGLFFRASSTTLRVLDIESITDDITLPYAEKFISFVSKLTMLETCRVVFRCDELKLLNPTENLRCKLLRTLLDNCTDLRILRLDCRIFRASKNGKKSCLTIDLPVLEKLIESKIESLDLYDLIELDLEDDYSDGLKNYSLKYLNVTEGMKWPFVFHVFRGLRACSIPLEIMSSASLVESMTEYHKNLASLVVELSPQSEADRTSIGGSSSEDDDLEDADYGNLSIDEVPSEDEDDIFSKLVPLSKFTNLKHLDLTVDASHRVLLPNFPNLEYLSVQFTNYMTNRPIMMDERFFNMMATYAPRLKFLTMSHYSWIPTPLIENLCKTLKRLQFLSVIHDKQRNFSLEEVEALFQSSQLLRFLAVESCTSSPSDTSEDEAFEDISVALQNMLVGNSASRNIRRMFQGNYPSVNCENYFYDHSRKRLFWLSEAYKGDDFDFSSREMNLFGYDSSVHILPLGE